LPRAIRWGLQVLVAVSVFVLLIPICTPAQSVNAEISGVINDSTGGIIPKATVTALNEGTGITRSTESNSSGSYSLSLLQPGNYSITVKDPGFATVVRSGITLTVGAQLVLNLTLQVGSINQQVEVTTAAPTVELSSSTLSAVVNSSTVLELPLNGRDWTQLAVLQPGVSSVGSIQPSIGGSQSASRANRGFGLGLTISGGRPQQNNYRLDGISINDYMGAGPGSVLGATLGVDAIQEFSVLTSNYSAEYGRTSGGVVNAITRGGTNQFHGDAYEFLRNNALDARNFFDATIPPFRRNQFGASAGGPIRKDRTFVFGDYEGLRQSLGVTNVDTVPSTNARNGILEFPGGPSTFPSGCTSTNNPSDPNQCQVTVDSLVKPFLVLWTPPNAGLLGTGDTGTFSFAAQAVTAENFVTARIDHKFSDMDSLSGSFQYDKSITSLPDGLNDNLVGQKAIHDFVGLEETHVFSPQLINVLRGGFNRVDVAGGAGIRAINPASADKSLTSNPGWDAPTIKVAGITTFGGGLDNTGFLNAKYNSFQGYDDVSFNKGIQNLKFGVAVERMQLNLLQDNTDGGQFSFDSLFLFLTNQPTGIQAGLPGAHTPRNYRQTIFGAYFQDDVRIRPNLIVNLGLRYEMSSVPTETQGKLSAMRSPTDTAPHLGNPFFANPTLRNFEPRIGFAWDPFRNGKTSVRGGFGLFDVLPLIYEYELTELSLAPFTLAGAKAPLPAGSFPLIAFSLLQGQSHLRVAYIEPHPRRNYVMQWNLNVQREISPNLTATVAYVGSHGVHNVFRGDDMNYVMPTLTPAGYLWPSPGGSGTVLNPQFGRIDVTTWGSSSFYDALQLQVLKVMSHGFQVQGAFTWGKSIDEGSAGALGDPYDNSISNMFWFDRKTRRGLSDYNIDKNLIINFIWNIPTAKSLQGPAAWALGGWQLGGIFQASTGLPFTPLMGGDPLGLNSSNPYAYPNRLTGSGCKTAVNSGNPNQYIKVSCFSVPNPITLLGNAGRNSLIGPGLENFDFSLFKNNYIKRISETFNVQFRAEFFNVFNRPNFLPPTKNSAVFDGSGGALPGAGLITGTSTTAREIQFALKLAW
jgi:hypothetical protein